MSVVEEIQKQIEEMNEKIKNIQDNCIHPVYCLEVIHRSNTDNYDPNDDCYWTLFHCRLCDKMWEEDGSHTTPK